MFNNKFFCLDFICCYPAQIDFVASFFHFYIKRYHLPYITVEVAHRVAAAGISVLAIDCVTVECQTQGHPLRMTGDVHPVLLGHEPPVFILEGVAGDRIAPQAGFVPTEGVLEVIPRRTNAAGAEAAHARVFLSFYRGLENRQRLEQLLAMVTPEYLYG